VVAGTAADPVFWYERSQRARRAKLKALRMAASLAAPGQPPQASATHTTTPEGAQPDRSDPAFWQAKARKAAALEARARQRAARSAKRVRQTDAAGAPAVEAASDPAFWEAKAEKARLAKEQAQRRARKLAKAMRQAVADATPTRPGTASAPATQATADGDTMSGREAASSQ